MARSEAPSSGGEAATTATASPEVSSWGATTASEVASAAATATEATTATTSASSASGLEALLVQRLLSLGHGRARHEEVRRSELVWIRVKLHKSRSAFSALAFLCMG